jgi:nucleoside-diphosphate-sugar epimerase
VLVAGGAGFIGSHLVDALIEADMEVVVIDNLSTGKMEYLRQHRQNKKFCFVKGDVRDFKLVEKVVEDVNAVFNLAAIVSVPRSIENPLLVNEVNLGGTLNLLKASLDNGVKRFIQSSSASVYGNTEELPIHEGVMPKPISPYAVAELAAEEYARVFFRVYGLETVCLRYFNVYGPRQTYSLYSGAITIFLNQLLRNQAPTIFGDGEQTRDFVFVQDVVSANMLGLVHKGAPGEVFNISSGSRISINKLVKMLQEIMNKTTLKPSYEAPRPGDIRHSCANIEKAKSILGYSPRFYLLEGLEELVKWREKIS